MTKSVDSGRLRHRVTYEQLPADLIERDSDGEIVETWIALFDRPLPTSIHPLSVRLLLVAAAERSKVTHRFVVRYRREFETPNAIRAIYRGTTYTIEGAIPDEDSGRRYQTLLASSGVR